jgi:hypothetical protein
MYRKKTKDTRLLSIIFTLAIGVLLVNKLSCEEMMSDDEDEDFGDDYQASGYSDNSEAASSSESDNQVVNVQNRQPVANPPSVDVNTYKETNGNLKSGNGQQQQQQQQDNLNFDENEEGAEFNNDENSVDDDNAELDEYVPNDSADQQQADDIVKPNNVESSNSNDLTQGLAPIFTYQSSRSKLINIITKPGILAGIVGGVIIGILTAFLLIMFIVYRMRKKDEGSYALEETKKPLNAYDYRHCPTKEFYA